MEDKGRGRGRGCVDSRELRHGAGRCPGGVRADGDRLVGRQLHLRRGRALARQRLGTVRDQVGDRPGRFRLRRLGLSVRPGSGLRLVRGEWLPSLRRGADPQCPGGGGQEAEPRLLRREGGEHLARVDGGQPHFGESPQADQLVAVARRDEVRMVVLTVGANDVGFGELVAACALDWARSSLDDPVFCRDGAQADLEAALPAMGRGLSKALRGIRAAMSGAGYRMADYRLVVMGYASPFPAGRWIRYPEDGWSRLSEGGCPVWNADANWAAGPGIGSIVATIHAAATAAGAEFLDLRQALDGHQLCDRRSRRIGPEGPAPASAEWSAASPSSRVRAASLCIPTHTDSARSAPVSPSYTSVRAATTPAPRLRVAATPTGCASRRSAERRFDTWPPGSGTNVKARASAEPPSARPGGHRGRSREPAWRPSARGGAGS